MKQTDKKCNIETKKSWKQL